MKALCSLCTQTTAVTQKGLRLNETTRMRKGFLWKKPREEVFRQYWYNSGGGQQLQYISLSTLSVKAQNWLKGEFYDGPDLPTVKSIGYNAKNML